MNKALKHVEASCDVIVRAFQDDATIAGDPAKIFGPGKARDVLNAGFSACGNETHPEKSVAYCILPEDRSTVPEGVHQPSFTILDDATELETRAYGVEICGAPLGEKRYRVEWLRLKAIEISDKIDNISSIVATLDPHCSTAITIYSLQSLADFVLATNYPSETKYFADVIDAALQRAFTKSHGTNLLDPEVGRQDPPFTSDRAKLRTSKGGAAIRPLANRQLFLNSMCNVIPQLIDRADSAGSIIQGLFPSLESVLGKGSFDHANSDSRWATFIASGSKAAAEFASEYDKGKELHRALSDQIIWPADSERPPSIFDTPLGSFGSGTTKVHKAIQDERQGLQLQLLTARAFNLPSDDPRRMAFLANGTDQFARQLLGTLPFGGIPFTPQEWTTAVALHMGVPVPALINRVGETIRNNSNCPLTTVDQYGYNLTTVAGIEGGGTQRNHNGIARVVSSSLLVAGIKHRGGATDTSCKTVFRDAVPRDAPISEDSSTQINSMIPDLVTFTRHISPDNSALGGADHLIDVKTLAAGQAYKSNSRIFGNAVLKRQARVNTDYHATALRLDTRLHGTSPGERGPFTRTLFEYGGEGGRVLGPVVGAFGEASPDLGHLRDLCASEMASKHVEYFRMTSDQARGLFRHQLNRKWGHAIARGWSRLILDRLRDYTGPKGDNSSSRNYGVGEANEQYAYFNPAHSGRGSAQE
jgi:hypothetical protein